MRHTVVALPHGAQSDAAVAPTTVVHLPAAQDVHVLDPNAPTTLLHDPAEHATHAATDVAPSVGPQVPAGHARHAYEPAMVL